NAPWNRACGNCDCNATLAMARLPNTLRPGSPIRAAAPPWADAAANRLPAPPSRDAATLARCERLPPTERPQYARRRKKISAMSRLTHGARTHLGVEVFDHRRSARLVDEGAPRPVSMDGTGGLTTSSCLSRGNALRCRRGLGAHPRTATTHVPRGRCRIPRQKGINPARWLPPPRGAKHNINKK